MAVRPSQSTKEGQPRLEFPVPRKKLSIAPAPEKVMAAAPARTAQPDRKISSSSKQQSTSSPRSFSSSG
eukprot:8263243-Alexandrium_andersonii.AAC.1